MYLAHHELESEFIIFIIIIIICRGAVQADAQALRAAVLLDELDFPGFGVPDPRTGHVVVEMRTPHSAALLKYSCSGRVLALPTVQLNARRLVFLLAGSAASSDARCLLSVSLSAVCLFVCCLSVCLLLGDDLLPACEYRQSRQLHVCGKQSSDLVLFNLYHEQPMLMYTQADQSYTNTSKARDQFE